MDSLKPTAGPAIRLAHEPAFSLGGLQVEPALRRVSREDGREEILQPRIMQVLVALCRSPGQILTRDDLTMRCWEGVVVGEDAINRVMSQLRRLSEGLGRGVFELQTVNKVGYRLRITAQNQAPPASAREARQTICVLPFANMSEDVEQGWFSDGITEDIITDLTKVSALSVTARNTAFAFKGMAIDVRQISAQLGVGYIVEGSVRKSGNRTRISAQLVDGAAGAEIWAERWDRDLSDIFALQDEISEAIVGALKLKLLPNEKRAIERRGTSSTDAYSLYLQAREHYVSCNQGSRARNEAIIRLAGRATEIDPNYARAWALMATAQAWLHHVYRAVGNDGLAAADRALSLDPTLPEALSVRAKALAESGEAAAAASQIALALRLDPNSYEAHEAAGLIAYRAGRIAEAIPHFETSSRLLSSDYASSGILIGAYQAVGDPAAARRAALTTRQRAEQVLATDPSNGGAWGFLAMALAASGEREAAKDAIRRALLIDPDNPNMRYNFACSLAVLGDRDGAFELLGPVLLESSVGFVQHAEADPDLAELHQDPRFGALIAAAKRRAG